LSDISSWKLFQWLTLWTTAFFYSSLNTQNQKSIADTYNLTNMTLLSWILWLTDLRNICAHYDKLWWIKMTRYLSFKHPKLKNLNLETNSIFSYTLVMQIFLKEIWIDSHFLDKIEKLFNEEEFKSINKEKMWFWEKWKEEIESII
jgi:abortive infection bacteriophage resistance protein